MALIPVTWTWNLTGPGTHSNLLQQFHLSCSGSSLLHMRFSQQVLLFSFLTVSTASGLTLAPTRVAAPTTLIMLYKPSNANATSPYAGFWKALSTTMCITVLANNNLFTGFYIVTSHKCI